MSLRIAVLTALLGVGSADYLVNPCLTDAFKAAKFCDAALPINDRVDDAVSRLNITEKINALGTNTGPIDSLGLPAYNWWSEASTGVATDDNIKTTK